MILELKNVYKAYVQGNMYVPVLKNINLAVNEGEYVAIMGPSGSGKCFLDKADSGTYLLDGEDISEYKDKELSYIRNKSIGFVFQTFNLMPRQSAVDNVALPLQYAGIPKKERRELCLNALDMVGLADRVNFKPTQLSGGQKQRVAIARAMVNSPKILLADEPTGALDSKSGIQIMDLFNELHNQGVTIVMITHSDEIAAHADRIIRLVDGQITDDSADPEVAIQYMADMKKDRESSKENGQGVTGDE